MSVDDGLAPVDLAPSPSAPTSSWGISDDPTSLAVTITLAAYVGVSLTIPFWVPIVKKMSGDCGVFWVRGHATLCLSARVATSSRNSSRATSF